MDNIRQIDKIRNIHLSANRPSNGNGQKPLSMGRTVFPDDAVARSYKPCRAVTTSGTARTNGWRLVFERRSAPFIGWFMG